ncbi:MAG: hypothetical protein IPM47_17030 [Sphingobacteriales bacterium]|nr:MAG: hypothetical protein IPM47_17030 [Sphingobacteriales bacterium]
MKNHFCIFLFVICFSTGSLIAQTNFPCKTLATKDEIIACSVMQLLDATLKMDSIYQVQVNKSKTDSLLRIRENHKLWKKFSESICQCEADNYSDLSTATINEYQCLTRVTNEYINHLEMMSLDNQEQKP